MASGDLGSWNIDVAARSPDADVNNNRLTSCFRDHGPQISKLFALCVGRANDKNALHLRSTPAAHSDVGAAHFPPHRASRRSDSSHRLLAFPTD
jgi:hypothetical protein